MLERKSVSGVQDTPALELFHTPPPAAPAYMMFGLDGWTTSARVRPPTFPGPSQLQVPRASIASGRVPSWRREGRIRPTAVECCGMSFIRSRASKYHPVSIGDTPSGERLARKKACASVG